MKLFICALFFSSALCFTSLDWSNAIDFKADRVIFTATKSSEKSYLDDQKVPTQSTWYPVTTLPDVVLDHASSFLEREAGPDESLYGFQWSTMSKGQLGHKQGATIVDGVEYLVYRVPTAKGMPAGSSDLERAHKLPESHDGFEYAVVKPDTMQILNTKLDGPVRAGSLKRTPTMRMAFKPMIGNHGASSFMQAEAMAQSPLKFGDWAVVNPEKSAPAAKAAPTSVSKATKAKSLESDDEALQRLESSFVETEAEFAPLYMMTGNAILTGGMAYNQAVMDTHKNVEAGYTGAVNSVAQATGHPVVHGVAAAANFGSQVRTGYTQAVGTMHNTVLGTAKTFTEAWIPKTQ